MQRPEIIDKLMAIIDQKNIQVNDNNRFTYLNFLSAARAAQDNPDGLSLKLGWYAMSDKARYKANCRWGACVSCRFMCVPAVSI
mmetsp:Transcript_23674/g.40272  ORF Transcript_23674/g.40272 Transcript_23674/m.40272 type:complete len:84 (+) Transcript_23674:346-597(+)